MDERLMIRVGSRETEKEIYCTNCDKVHTFRYSHLKIDKGKRYHAYVGDGCFIMHLEEITR